MGARLFGVVFVLFSLVFLAFGGYLVYEQERALRSFESTEATVLDTGVDRQVDREPGEPDDVTYEPVVEYRYRVDGETHTADNVYPGGTAARSDRGWAQRVVDGYDAGETVTAYYDPDEPGEAYLVQQRDLTKFLFVLAPLFFLAVGALLWWRSTWDSDTGDSSVTAATTVGGHGNTPDADGPDTGEPGDPRAGGDGADGTASGADATPGADGTDAGETSDVEYGDWGGDGERE